MNQKNIQDIGNNGLSSSLIIDVLKWLIGTVGLGVAGYLINLEYQKAELEIKRLEVDTKLLEVVTKSAEKRTDNTELSYLTYIQTFLTTTQIKDEIKNRIIVLKAHIEETGNDHAKQTEFNQKKILTAELNDTQKDLFEQKRKEEELIDEKSILKSIEQLKNDENIIAKEVPSIDSSTTIINSVQQTVTPITISEDKKIYTLVGSPVTKWCKKGYYVKFNNTLRIGIRDLEKNSVTINLKDIEENNDNPIPFSDSEKLSEGEVFQKDHNNYRYKISLNYIGSAGKNPFTRAAYLTVSTYIEADI